MSYFYKENPKLENKVTLFFDLLSKSNEAKYNAELSILLLGSLSRGEGSWAQNKENDTVLLSDIEFLTIHPNNFEQFKEFDEDIRKASREAFGDESSKLFHIDNSYCSVSNLHKLEKKLLIFDAIEMGKTVIGEDYKYLLPKINIYNINLIDIRDILTHRAFSVLYYGYPLKKEGKIEEYRYSLAKNSLDLMTVILVNNGMLVSGFQNRLKKIEGLAIDDSLKRYFEYCLSIKLSIDSEYDFTIEKMEMIFMSLIQQLDREFKCHILNCVYNIKSIVRRKLGTIKRGILVGNVKISQKKHLHNLFKDLEDGHLKTSSIKDNYVLNGYPIIG